MEATGTEANVAFETGHIIRQNQKVNQFEQVQPLTVVVKLLTNTLVVAEACVQQHEEGLPHIH